MNPEKGIADVQVQNPNIVEKRSNVLESHSVG